MLIDFDSMTGEQLEAIGVSRWRRTQVAVPQVSVSVSVTPVQRTADRPATQPVRARQIGTRTHLLAQEQDWDWRQLRDYVVGQIEHFHGPQPRDPRKEKSIFSSFLDRWGSQAPLIAKAAFEVHQGMWQSAPISVNRFCKASDGYFAQVIAERL